MAMMAKMRNLAPAFILLVGGIFVLFMVISDSRVLEIFGQTGNNVGSINGVDISQDEFANYLDQARERQKSQTGRDVDDENQDALNDQVWESVLNQELLKEQIEKYNITVTDQEINDIIFSANPPAFLKNQFIDSLGRFNRQLYESTILKQNKEVLVAIEDQVRQMQLTQKLQNYLFASVNVSEAEIRRKFEEQNTKIKAEYLLADINSIADNEVSVSNDDLKEYYNNHLDEFKIQHQRKLKYILFSKSASQADSLSIKNNLAAIATKAKEDTSFKSYIEIYSEQPYSKDTLSHNSLSPEAAEILAGGQPGQILGPVATYEGYVVYKLLNKIPSSETYVRASHILIPTGTDENKAREEATGIYNRLIAGENFAKLAKEYSTDPGSAQKGGDLGWFGKGRMVKEFEEASFNGKIGEIQKPVKSNFGFHIIKVTGKSSSNFVVEKIVNKVKVSGTTIENAYSSATDFAYVAEENGFDSEAKLMNYKVQETPLFVEDTYGIPSLGANKALLEWTFDNDLNDISPVFKMRQGYIVAQISGIEKPGVKKFEDVEKSLKPLVIKEKKFDKAKSLIEKAYSGVKSSGNLMTASLSDKIKYDTTGSFSPSGMIPKLGREFSFVNKAMELDVNKVSEPVKGTRGYYIIKVTERTPFNSSMYSMQRNSLRDNILQEKKSYFFEQWLAQLKKNADIVDNRNRIYR